jgi:hypothetical protein
MTMTMALATTTITAPRATSFIEYIRDTVGDRDEIGFVIESFVDAVARRAALGGACPSSLVSSAAALAAGQAHRWRILQT